MSKRKMFMAGAALAGLCAGVALFATNFQLNPITPSDVRPLVWPTGTVSPGVTTVTWSINTTNAIAYSDGNSSAGTTLASGSTLKTLLGNAFTTWSSAQYEGTNVNNLSFVEGSDNSNTAFNGSDCVNSIGFTQDLGSTGIIAETQVSQVFTVTPGSPAGNYSCSVAPTTRNCPNEVCIVDADVEFNTHYNFYTPSYATPPSSYFDLQTVATHEIGHMVGLDHSGMANAVMYPYGDTGTNGIVHALAVDDKIGSGYLYTNPAILTVAGDIKGNVKVGGSNAFGVHVVAIDSTTGNIITDTLTDTSGNYELHLVAGSFYVVVLPLATDTSGDSGTNGVTRINNYGGFHSGYPAGTVVTNFTGKYY